MVKRTLLFAIAVVVLVASAATAAKMPSGSFLAAPVYNTEQLAKQTTDNSLVATRYAKFYGMSRNAVVDYFMTDLRIGMLKSDFEATVYLVSGKTDFRATTKLLRKGSYVFIGKSGQPVLEAGTGNPIGAQEPLPKAGDSGTGEVVTKVLGSSAELGPAGAVITPGAADLLPAVEIVSEVPIGAGPALVAAGSGSGALLPLALLAGAGAALAGGGGGSGGSPPSPIPEPSSLASLALGASAIGLGWMKRRRW